MKKWEGEYLAKATYTQVSEETTEGLKPEGRESEEVRVQESKSTIQRYFMRWGLCSQGTEASKWQ